MTKKNIALLLLLNFIIFGCASLQPGYETPTVSISSFEAVPTQNIIPQFKIGLHIVNPNRTPLNLKGVSYTLFLENHKILTGVSNKLPQIEAYGEGNVILNASVDLFSSIGFFTDMIQNQRKEQLTYSLKAKLDAGTLHPMIHVTREGKISLSDSPKKKAGENLLP